MAPRYFKFQGVEVIPLARGRVVNVVKVFTEGKYDPKFYLTKNGKVATSKDAFDGRFFHEQPADNPFLFKLARAMFEFGVMDAITWKNYAEAYHFAKNYRSHEDNVEQFVDLANKLKVKLPARTLAKLRKGVK